MYDRKCVTVTKVLSRKVHVQLGEGPAKGDIKVFAFDKVCRLQDDVLVPPAGVHPPPPTFPIGVKRKVEDASLESNTSPSEAVGGSAEALANSIFGDIH